MRLLILMLLCLKKDLLWCIIYGFIIVVIIHQPQPLLYFPDLVLFIIKSGLGIRKLFILPRDQCLQCINVRQIILLDICNHLWSQLKISLLCRLCSLGISLGNLITMLIVLHNHIRNRGILDTPHLFFCFRNPYGKLPDFVKQAVNVIIGLFNPPVPWAFIGDDTPFLHPLYRTSLMYLRNIIYLTIRIWAMINPTAKTFLSEFFVDDMFPVPTPLLQSFRLAPVRREGGYPFFACPFCPVPDFHLYQKQGYAPSLLPTHRFPKSGA